MVKKIFTITTFVLSALFAAALVLLLMFWQVPLFNYYQNLDYSISNEYIKNPDQGFYRTVFIKLTEDGGTFTPVLYEDFQMYHLRIDISDFSDEISYQAKRTLTSALNFYSQNQKNVIVRFSYDPYFEGTANNEPPIDTIISHIGELAEILNDFAPTITAIEAGMIGPWGEMHTSEIATSENINKVIDAWLNNCPDLCVLVRTPKMIYDYLGIDFNNISNYTFTLDEKTIRLGLFNDAFLSTENDLGTYTYNREEEINWISKNITHTPYGGEVLSSSIGLNSFPNCLDEMDALNLSYLNYEYQESVIEQWKNTEYQNSSAFDYIQTHMGYRPALTNSAFWYNNDFRKLEIYLTIENSGFSNYVREKDVTIIFVTENGETYEYNVGKFNGERDLHFTLTNLPPKQNYDVYISLSNIVENERTYSLQFANTILYNSNLQANLIGHIKV